MVSVLGDWHQDTGGVQHPSRRCARFPAPSLTRRIDETTSGALPPTRLLKAPCAPFPRGGVMLYSWGAVWQGWQRGQLLLKDREAGSQG